MSFENKKFQILPDNLMLHCNDIRSLNVTETSLYESLLTTNSALCLFVKLHLLNNKMSCPNCSTAMHLKTDKSVADGLRWRCCNCNKQLSVRHRSIFSESRLPLQILMKLLYKLSHNIEIMTIAHDLVLTRKTVSVWASLVRDAIITYFEKNKVKVGGFSDDGTSLIVEMDESLFFKRKYNRGLIRNGQWYVAGVERGSKKAFIVPVENRNANTMRNIIVDNVHQGSTIVTDEWRAYGAALRNLPEFTHLTVNHSFNFVDPDDPSIHTQSVESFWSHCKKDLRRKNGINKTAEFDHLVKFIWERGVDKFKKFNEIIILFMSADYDSYFE